MKFVQLPADLADPFNPNIRWVPMPRDSRVALLDLLRLMASNGDVVDADQQRDWRHRNLMKRSSDAHLTPMKWSSDATKRSSDAHEPPMSRS